MPELPEVETVVRGLAPQVIGRRLSHLETRWRGTIATPSPEEFDGRIAGQSIVAARRRAKYIILQLEHDYLLIHLKMTGRLYVHQGTQADPDERWVRAIVHFEDGAQLRFSDARKFGKLYLTAQLESITGKLGPEPLEERFTLAEFQARIDGQRRALKPLLLDQSFIAGVGNIYADEALFRAHLHPLRRADSLQANEIQALYHEIRGALNDGIQQNGASVNWYRQADGTRGEAQEHLYAYGRDGQACERCGTLIEKMWVAQRGTHYCPQCQRLSE